MSFYFKNKTFNSKILKILFFLSQNVGAETFGHHVILPASHFTNTKLNDTQHNGTHH